MRPVRARAAGWGEGTLDLGLSDRAFATTTGLGQVTVRSITDSDALAGQVTVATLKRILNESGLSPDELLAPAPTPPGTPGPDPALLAQALLGDTRMHPRERLATCLG